MRTMGLDIGEKTVGVAISDAMGISAQPIETIHYESKKKAMGRLLDLVREHEVSSIVTGMPLNMNGSFGPQAEKVELFAEELKTFVTKHGFPIKLFFWDERMSTMEANRLLISADVSRKKRKKVIDKMAAVIILQSHLDSQRPY